MKLSRVAAALKDLMQEGFHRPLAVLSVTMFLFCFLITRMGKNPVDEVTAQLEGAQVRVSGYVSQIRTEDTYCQVRLNGIHLEEAKPNQGGMQSTFSGKQKKVLNAHQALLYFNSAKDCPAAVGELILAEGIFASFAGPANPGSFDAKSYYRSTGCFFRLSDCILLGRGGGQSVKGLLALLRQIVCGSFDRILPAQSAGVMRTITMGDSSAMDQEIRKLFQEGGIAHILAISGLHVQMVGQALYRLLRKRRASFALAGGLSALTVFAYCLMAGMSTSALRAMVMFLLWIGAQLLGRTPDPVTSLGLAGSILLIQNPYVTWQSAFYLSFGCILSLMFLTDPIKGLLPTSMPFSAQTAASLSVTLGTFPLSAWFFYQITPWSALLNLLVIPCMGILYLLGLSGALVGLCLPLAGSFLAAPCHYLLQLFLRLCVLERRLPGGVLVTGRPKVFQMAGYYLLLGMFVFFFHAKSATGGRKGRKRALAILLLAGSVPLLLYQPAPRARLVFLNVGQGDGALVCAGKTHFLIDCGSSDVTDVWERQVKDCLKYYGIRRLDGIFFSHGDSDHINGAAALFASYERTLTGGNAAGIRVDHIYYAADALAEDPGLQRMVAMAREAKLSATGLRMFDQLTFPGGLLTYLYPDEAGAAAGDANQNSMVLLLKTGDLQVFFTGDLELSGEERFLELYRKWQAKDMEQAEETRSFGETSCRRILKVGHHGSKNATCDQLLELLAPDLAVISCGKHNRYGHPAREVLERLQRFGIPVRRTDEEGGIVITGCHWQGNGLALDGNTNCHLHKRLIK